MYDFSFLKGSIETIILNALYSGDKYGYEIAREIKEKTENKYEIKQPTLYGYLKRLEQSKLGMWHPKNNAQILQGDKVVGTIGIIHPQVMSDAVGFELDLSAFDFQLIGQEVAPVLSKFPKTELDFTFVWNGVFADLDAIWRKYHNPLVVKYCLSGVFENKFTLTFTLSSTEKTLDKAEINKIHQEILDFATQNSVHLG